MLRSDTKVTLYSVFLFGVALIILTHQLTLGELFFNNDETRHAMTGVYFYDVFRDFPSSFGRLYDYTWEYYARYPALGLLVWPPFFYLVEAVFYALFGVSATAARLTVVGFSLTGLFFWYKLVRAIYGERLALFASLLFVANPYIVLYSKQVMLEIPSLALCLATIYFFYRYTETERRRHLVGFALSFALAILTKIHVVFMAPLFFLYLLHQGKLSWLWRREVLWALGCIALAVGPYSILAFKVQSGRFAQELVQGTAAKNSVWTALLFYPVALADQLGPIILSTSLAYLAFLIYRRALGREALFIFWILACFAVFLVIAQKSERFTIYWIPPFLLMSVLLIDSLAQRLGGVRLATVALAILATGLLVRAYTTPREYIQGYEEAARYVIEHYQPKTTVFFHGYYDGNLIFHLRKQDPMRRLPVLVGTKMLVATNIFTQYGLEVRIKDQHQIEDLFTKYGTKYILLDDLDTVEWPGKLPPIFDVLRAMLQSSPHYRLVKRIPIQTNIPAYQGHAISIYENQKDVKLATDWISFKMLTLGGREVWIKLD